MPSKRTAGEVAETPGAESDAGPQGHPHDSRAQRINLIAGVWQRVTDGRVLALIQQWLDAPVMEPPPEGIRAKRSETSTAKWERNSPGTFNVAANAPGGHPPGKAHMPTSIEWD